MRVQTFRFRHTFDCSAEIYNSVCGQFLKRNFFYETIERNAAERFRITAGRQSVICAGSVIARDSHE